eukprot:m.234846 g.234846  ORF g.234846 m.234846 type:complete len:135 (-) comp16038_c0_seq13:1836-2240(-)
MEVGGLLRLSMRNLVFNSEVLRSFFLSRLTGRFVVKLRDSGKSIKVKFGNLLEVETVAGLQPGFLNDSRKKGTNIEEVKPKSPSADFKVLNEVQEGMKDAGPMLEKTKDEWCTPDLLVQLRFSHCHFLICETKE